MRNIPSLRWGGTALATCAAWLAVPAAAQTESAASRLAAASEDGSGNGDIIVTARRREETLQDVPAAITAIGSATLETKAVNDLRALDGFIPNVNIQAATSSATSAQIFLRGVGTDTVGFSSDPNIGVYLDDVFIGRLVGSLVGALDLERIEVLRGPQGTLYGRNSTGGAIKYVTRKPSLTDNSAKLAVTLGTDDRRDIKGSVNLQLVPGELALLLSGQSRDQDGYIKLVDRQGRDSGNRANGMNAQDFRAALRWQPDAALTVDIAADVTRNRSGPQSLTPTACARDGLNGQFAHCSLYYNDPYTAYYDFPSNRPRMNGAGIAGTITWNTDLGTVKSVTGYRGFTDTFASNLTAKYIQDPNDPASTNNAAKIFVEQTLRQRQFQQELQIASSNDGPFNYIGGLFFYRERVRSISRNENAAIVANAAQPSGFAVSRSGFANRDHQTSQSAAVYGEVYFEPFEGLELTAGGRYSWDRRKVDRNFFPCATNCGNPAPGGEVVIAGVPTSLFDGKISSEKFTPKLGVSYDMGNILVFATYTEGYRPPGYVSSSPSSAQQQRVEYGIETETSYEAGFKANLFDRLLTLNATAFSAKYNNLQNTQTINGETIVVSADAKIKGIEVEFTLRPATGLSLFGNLGLLDTKYNKQPPGNPFAFKLKHAPETNFMLGGQYETSFGGIPGEFFVGADWQHTGKAFRNVANTVDQASAAYDLVTARFGYRSEGDRWSLTAGGTNLLDKVYYLLGTQNQARSYQPGRRFYVTAEVNF